MLVRRAGLVPQPDLQSLASEAETRFLYDLFRGEVDVPVSRDADVRQVRRVGDRQQIPLLGDGFDSEGLDDRLRVGESDGDLDGNGDLGNGCTHGSPDPAET